MNVFLHELKTARFSVIRWTIAILLLTALYMSVYPAFARDAAAFSELVKNIPTAMEHIMGAGLDMMLFSFLGFFANIFPFITLIGAIHASVLGFTILNKERIAKTTDFLLTKPKTRASIFWQKIAACAVALAVTQALVGAGAFALATLFDAGAFNTAQFVLFWGAFSIIQFFIFMLSVLLSQLVKKVASPVPPALALCFGLFLFALFAVIVGDDTVRWLTPFRFIDYHFIITDTAYEPAHVLYAAALTTIFTAASYGIYTQKDVPASI